MGQLARIARRAALVGIPLLLGAGAMALFLDSGTLHLPSTAGISSAPPAESVVVSAPAHHRPVHAPRAPVAPTPAPVAPVTAPSTSTATAAHPGGGEPREAGCQAGSQPCAKPLIERVRDCATGRRDRLIRPCDRVAYP